jgi:predicted nucleotidyltransferase component of viral defense system
MPNLPEDEAIEVVFKAIALSDKLSNSWVLKGGNALKKVFKSPRASVDLDFTEKDTITNEDEKTLNEFLETACEDLNDKLQQVVSASKFEDLVVQSKQIKPRNVSFLRDHPAFEVKVGYSLRDDREPPYMDAVKLEISLNDVVCEDQLYEVDGGTIKVCSLNDIIAEKLRSLIQQKEEVRNRSRPNDVFDIWFYHTRLEYLFNYEKISEFIIKKGKAKFDESLIKKSTFTEDQELRQKAQVGFEEIEERVANVDFPSFEEAYTEVVRVVKKLSIPD